MTPIRRAFARALACALLLAASPALAQTARVVTDCTVSMSLPTRDAAGLMVDQFGRLCTTSSGATAGATTVAGSMEQDVRTTGPLNAATANAAITTAINGQATVGYTFTGLTASGATLTYEQSIDGGTTWTGINAVNRGTGVPEATRTTDGQIALSATGRTTIRVRVSTPGTGTITVATNVSVREGIFSLGSPLPPGGNTVGSIANTAFGITGPLPAGSNTIGAVTQASGPWTVSGTVTANLGALNGAATAAGQTAQQGSVAPGTAAAASVLAGQIYSTTPPAPTNGQQLALQSDAAGNLKVNNATLPPGAATAANQSSEIAALGAPADTAYGGTGAASIVAALKGLYASTTTRQVSYIDFNGQAIGANSQSTQTTRVASPAYTKFNATAGCDASGGFLVVRGSNDGFATTISVALTGIPANSRNSATAGATITAPVAFAAYHAWILNGANANTCSLVSSYTAN